MPLTLELFDANSTFGQIIVDRDNLILFFPPASNSTVDKNKAFAKRAEVTNSFGPLFEILTVGRQKLMHMHDPGHLHNDHMSEYDKGTCHAHFKFKDIVDFSIFLKAIGALADKNCISPKCAAYMQEAGANYFEEINKESKAMTIEKDYQREKAARLEQQEKALAYKERIKRTQQQNSGEHKDIPTLPLDDDILPLLLASLLSRNPKLNQTLILSTSIRSETANPVLENKNEVTAPRNSTTNPPDSFLTFGFFNSNKSKSPNLDRFIFLGR